MVAPERFPAGIPNLARSERGPDKQRITKEKVTAALCKIIKDRHTLARHGTDDEQCFAPIGSMIDPRFPEKAARYNDCDAQFRLAVADIDSSLREQATKAYNAGIDRCRTITARRLFPWLVCQRYSYFLHNPCVLAAGEGQRLKPYTVAVLPGFKIAGQPIDFALAMRKQVGPARFVLIDCKGREDNGDDEVSRARGDRDAQRAMTLLAYERVMGLLVLSGRDIGEAPRRMSNTCAQFVHDCMFNKGTKLTNLYLAKSRSVGYSRPTVGANTLRG